MSSRRTSIRLLPFISALLIVSLACSVGGATTPEPGQDTGGDSPAPDSATPTPEVEADPLPISLSEYLARYVEEGGDPVEGSIAILNHLTAQGDLPEGVRADAGVNYDSIFGFTSQVGLLLEGDLTDDQRAEIQRLLQILAPSEESLQRYARPAEASSGKTASPYAEAARQVECATLWAEGFPADPSPPICLEYRDSVTYGGGFRARAYYATEDSTDTTVQTAIRLALDAIVDAANTYQGLGLEIGNANLIFTLLENPGEEGTYAMVPGRSAATIAAEPCPIMVYPVGVESLSEEQFKQAVAHEFYHCVQDLRYGYTNYGVTDWWIESSATYFSNVVYPTANQEWEYVFDFDLFSARFPLVHSNLAYADVVFWFYVSQTSSLYDVLYINDSLSNSRGGADVEASKANQLVALSGWPGMDELFFAFSKAYLDRQISDTGGGFLSLDPAPGNVITFPGGGEMETHPFVVTRYRVRFNEGYLYNITQNVSGASGNHAVRPSVEGDEWGNLPDSHSTACGESTFRLVLVSTDPSAVSDPHTLELETDEEETLDCDECLIGHWEMSVDFMRPTFASFMASTANAELIWLIGGYSVDIFPDGTFVFQPIGLSTRVRQYTNDLEPIDFEYALGGYSTGRWGISSPGVLVTTDEVPNFAGVATITAGEFINEIVIEDFPGEYGLSTGFGAMESTYSCTGNELITSTPPAALVPQLIYYRISPEPIPFVPPSD
ncbi:MAG: hypothetical protein EPO32_10520 [Anaerolineae bacterium]|nr:MAG: hypothetical protein EPO32_10520 [Anaerolineae bacterium]